MRRPWYSRFFLLLAGLDGEKRIARYGKIQFPVRLAENTLLERGSRPVIADSVSHLGLRPHVHLGVQ